MGNAQLRGRITIQRSGVKLFVVRVVEWTGAGIRAPDYSRSVDKIKESHDDDRRTSCLWLRHVSATCDSPASLRILALYKWYVRNKKIFF